MPDGGSSATRRRVAVVTGGGGGIGSETCYELARQGITVIAMDPGVGLDGEPLHEPTAEAVADKIRASGGVARSSDASVTDRGAMRQLFGDVLTKFGALDIVINTAGILRSPPFWTPSRTTGSRYSMSTSTAISMSWLRHCRSWPRRDTGAS